jgi:tRNA (guanine-N7-)-methyltransferase
MTGTSAAPVVYDLRSILQRLDLAELFPIGRPLEIELGCGDGSFLVDHSRLHPQHNFIGVERLLGRVRKVERKSRRERLCNLRAVRIESTYFLQYLLPERSSVALHVYFPDPWPKRRHRRHRLVNEQFPNLAGKALVDGGRVYLRTDDHDYFDQMVRVFSSSSLFASVDTPADLAALTTDFERGFLARGISTLRAAYQKR